ncbi:co-chaperone DjlA [Photobacterium aphoticum]|uniref:Co-chaperone protein DjlA n=1 Tax=Photobacterium aphoticum TaxID=754436 RepID=A0A0J1GGF5_9GAMM|nr:co-chaperone DjlA [Photobacterium aphoticum]KLU98774.1 molecular chaperone DnaJ [Photobacterium aphoticum]PSU55409.1 co-chaperone DjlA [Photobacterium aphoticum]GHA65275.1 co-chaperone protein DjlA [Photobacterium aphoticum]
MQVWGKILGAFFGFLLGGPFGLLLGLFLGHKFDKVRSNIYGGGFGGFTSGGNQADRQAAFFHAAFAVMGHVAKAKGRVTAEEIRVASAIMDRMGLQGESRRQAQDAFREGKEEDFPLEDVLVRVRQASAGRSDLLQFFLEVQIQAAFADGTLHPSERQLLHVIARMLGFSERQLEQRLQMQEAAFRFQQGGFHQQYQQQGGFRQAPTRDQLADAYKVLGVSAEATAQELKRAYRKQMNEHHPDKLAAKGLPPEMMELAKQKTQELQAAYDLIRKEKGFK